MHMRLVLLVIIDPFNLMPSSFSKCAIVVRVRCDDVVVVGRNASFTGFDMLTKSVARPVFLELMRLFDEYSVNSVASLSV